jgi:hypothetical protein
MSAFTQLTDPLRRFKPSASGQDTVPAEVVLKEQGGIHSDRNRIASENRRPLIRLLLLSSAHGVWCASRSLTSRPTGDDHHDKLV